MPTSLAALAMLAVWAAAILSKPASSATAEAERTVPPVTPNRRRRATLIVSVTGGLLSFDGAGCSVRARPTCRQPTTDRSPDVTPRLRWRDQIMRLRRILNMARHTCVDVHQPFV